MADKSPFGRKLISAVESVDVFKKLKQADQRKMARVQKRSDQLDEAFDRSKLMRNLAYKADGIGYHFGTPSQERKARLKRLKKR